jgi:hypothetical protein
MEKYAYYQHRFNILIITLQPLSIIWLEQSSPDHEFRITRV